MTQFCAVVNGTRSFGGICAIANFSAEFTPGELVGVIGPNGSGKTTLLNCMSGNLHLSAGQVLWQGHDITSWPMHRIARAGLVRTFQQSMAFPSSTVAENLEAACAIARATRARRAHRPRQIGELLAAADLTRLADSPVASLSHGTLRLVGIAMTLATSPEMLLLDEPAAGLNEIESRDLAELIRAIHDDGVSVVVVDHDMSFITSLVDRLIVMASGQILAEGKPAEVTRDPGVIEVYLGTTGIVDKSPTPGGEP
jgi:ABC-type branched-subunit amino acid transport system ATPase component